jgi:hypothetical protein
MFVTLKVFKLIGPYNDGRRHGRGTYLFLDERGVAPLNSDPFQTMGSIISEFSSAAELFAGRLIMKEDAVVVKKSLKGSKWGHNQIVRSAAMIIIFSTLRPKWQNVIFKSRLIDPFLLRLNMVNRKNITGQLLFPQKITS